MFLAHKSNVPKIEGVGGALKSLKPLIKNKLRDLSALFRGNLVITFLFQILLKNSQKD